MSEQERENPRQTELLAKLNACPDAASRTRFVMGLSTSQKAVMNWGDSYGPPSTSEQEKTDQSRSAQPQLRAGESDPRDDDRGDSMLIQRDQAVHALRDLIEDIAAQQAMPDESWRELVDRAIGQLITSLSPAPVTPREAWQQFGTHPTDKRWFLGWNEDCGHFVFRDSPGLVTGEDPMPTHWMPLPLPPSQETP